VTGGPIIARTLAVAVLGLALWPLGVGPSSALAAQRTGEVRGLAIPASQDARRMLAWVVASADNRGMPFVVIDKVQARIFVYSRDGQLRGTAAILLGQARGDDSVPGIGERKLSSIRPEERTTPAGRFVASLGDNHSKGDIVWVDYAGALAMHRVVTSNPKERRLQRLATASSLDNRISYGCINVPAKFYDAVLRPAFTGASGIVYILPEVRSISEIFPAYSRFR
jgi:hypothetical protein